MIRGTRWREWAARVWLRLSRRERDRWRRELRTLEKLHEELWRQGYLTREQDEMIGECLEHLKGYA